MPHQILYHPDAATNGLEIQTEGIETVPRPSGTDVFRRPGDPTVHVAVSLVESPSMDSSGTPYLGGSLRRNDEGLDFCFELGMQRGLTVHAEGLELDSVKALIGTIPIVGRREDLNPPDDEPMERVPTAQELSMIARLDFRQEDIVYEGDHGGTLSVSAVWHGGGRDLWALFVASEELNPLHAFAMSSPRVRLIGSQYAATVVGEHRRDGPKQAYWVQRHTFWHLATLGTYDDLLARVEWVQGSLATGIPRGFGWGTPAGAIGAVAGMQASAVLSEPNRLAPTDSDSGVLGPGVSRRLFLRMVSVLGLGAGLAGLGMMRAAPAYASTQYFAPGVQVVCGSCTSCHHCGCNCGSYGCPADDTFYRKYNGTAFTQSCSGESGGPCGGSPRYCYGSPKSWMYNSSNKCCCCP